MSANDGGNATRLLVERLAVHVEHLAKNLDESQKQINQMVKAHTELNNTMIEYVGRENRKDRRLSDLELTTSKLTDAVVNLQQFEAGQKIISKISGVLTMSLVALISSITSSVILYFWLDNP